MKMIALLIILAFLVTLTTLLLVFPVRVVINTYKEKYFIGMPFFFNLSIYPNEDLLSIIKARVFGIPVKVLNINWKTSEKKAKKKRRRKRKKSKADGFSLSNARQLIKLARRQIKIKRFHLLIDTGDFPLNAQLIPLASSVNSISKTDISINFHGQIEANIYIETRISMLLIAFIKYKILTSKS